MVSEKPEEGRDHPSAMFNCHLSVPHFRGCNHLHGFCNLPNVLDGADPLLDCGKIGAAVTDESSLAHVATKRARIPTSLV